MTTQNSGHGCGDTIELVIKTAGKEWPPIFWLRKIDELSGDALRWRTLSNMRSRGEIPLEIFIKQGKKTLVLRDPFLKWWKTQLRQVTQKETLRATTEEIACREKRL